MIAGVLAIGPSEEVGLVLQMAAVGGLVGTAVAVVMRLRDDDADTWWAPALGALVRAAGTAAVLVVRAVT